MVSALPTNWNSPYSPVCALGTSPKGGSKMHAIPCLPPPPGALGVPQCAHWGGGGAVDGRGSPRHSASFVSVGAAISRPQTWANVRQAGRRGHRPLRSKPAFPRRDEHCSSANPGAGRTNGRPMVVPTAKREPVGGGALDAPSPEGRLSAARRPAPVSDRRAGNTRPYAAAGGFPVGAAISRP